MYVVSHKDAKGKFVNEYAREKAVSDNFFSAQLKKRS